MEIFSFDNSWELQLKSTKDTEIEATLSRDSIEQRNFRASHAFSRISQLRIRTYTILVIHRNALIDEDDNGNKW